MRHVFECLQGRHPIGQVRGIIADASYNPLVGRERHVERRKEGRNPRMRHISVKDDISLRFCPRPPLVDVMLCPTDDMKGSPRAGLRKRKYDLHSFSWIELPRISNIEIPAERDRALRRLCHEIATERRGQDAT